MSETSASEQRPLAPGFVSAPFWAGPAARVPVPRAGEAAVGGSPGDVGEPASPGHADDPEVSRDAADTALPGDVVGDDADDPAGSIDTAGATDTAGSIDTAGATDTADSTEDDEPEPAADDAGEADTVEDADDADADEGDEPEPEPDPQAVRRQRFATLVEERLERARYPHHLTRRVFTTQELITAAAVERRAAVWVPTMTFVATGVSAVAAVVLATRLRSDPTDPSGNQLVIVTITVCLLAAAFATLLRAEVYYGRLRPSGRLVRHDIADAYEVVRDAPRRLAGADAPLPVLRRVVGLMPTAEQLVAALAAYIADGGTRVRAHPAYERILRMRAEVEALEILLEEEAAIAVADPVVGVEAVLPRPEQVADYDGLADLVGSLGAIS